MTRALSLLMLSTMAFTSSALLPTVTKSLRRVGVGRRAATAMMSSSSALDIPSLTLANGRSHPMLGYGTYKVGFIPASASAAAAGSEASGATEVTAKGCVLDALDVGYRFLDCAEFYGNEHDVGAAIGESGVDRADLFLASKVWTTNIDLGADAVLKQVEKTLTDLDTDYLDLYCIHWPVPGKHVAAYQALERLHDEGVIRSLGLSNYAKEDYQELALKCNVAPQVNQIELNPFLYRRNTLEFFQGEGVAIQSYRTLRDGKAFEHPTLVAIGAKHGRSTAQVLSRWCTHKGAIAIPKSVRRARMAENAAVFDFSLDADDLAALDALTTRDALDAFRALYIKCVVRDTSAEGSTAGVKMDVTID